MSSVSSLNTLLSSASTPASSSSSSSIDISSLLAAATGASSTGIDVTSAVDAAIYAAQAPERQWQAQQATLQSQMTALGSIQTALASVTSDLNSLNDPLGAIAAKTVSSSNAAAVTATAAAGASSGSHTVSVASLATSASWYSSPLASAAASVGTSSFVISQANGTQTTFNLGTGSTSSLTALAGAINAASLGISASIVTDATGARLALVSQATGSASSFTVADSTSSASTWNSADLANASSTLPATTFSVNDAANSTTFTVAAGTTLSSLVSQINSAGLNTTASVVTDASGTHLSIGGNSGNSVTVSNDPTISLTQASAGTDAQLTVDGVPVSSASNTVTGAIGGVTLNLTSTTGSSPASLTVSADASQITSALSQFVKDYNSAVSLLNTQFTFSTSTQSQGVLGSDATVRSLQSVLLQAATYSSGTGASNGSVNSLSDLGITMNNDGSLSLNTSQLDQVINTSPDAVQSFLQGTSLNGFAGTVQNQLNGLANPVNGALGADMSSMTQEYNDLQNSVNNFESGYIASQRTVLTTMYSNAEIALQQLPTTLKQLQSQLGGSSGGN